MSADPVKNIATSVKNRLLSAARQSGKPFQSLLTHYGLERFLFRLSRSPLKEKFILKGGLLLVGLGLPMARTTRDIDFLGLILEDIEAMAEDAEYPGIRLKFDAWLGKSRIPMQIDVGFGDAVVPDAREMTFPTLLDMEPPVVKAYSIETIVAEKFEASLDLAELNSRMKDFYDIWMLSRAYPFHGPALQDAVMATCHRRATPLNSHALIFSKEFAARAEKRSQWTAFLRKAQIPGKSEDFQMIMEGIGEFLHPVAEASENQWRFEKEWLPGGPWRP